MSNERLNFLYVKWIDGTDAIQHIQDDFDLKELDHWSVAYFIDFELEINIKDIKKDGILSHAKNKIMILLNAENPIIKDNPLRKEWLQNRIKQLQLSYLENLINLTNNVARASRLSGYTRKSIYNLSRITGFPIMDRGN